jgi:integrase
MAVAVVLAVTAVVLAVTRLHGPRRARRPVRAARAGLAAVAPGEAAAGAPLPPTAPLFVDEDGHPFSGGDRLAERFREDLTLAGVDRAELFERSASRLRIRVHDLRATFITLNLANGKTETWIADRTGHKSSSEINGYRRGARTAAELGLGPLAPLDDFLAACAALWLLFISSDSVCAAFG